MDEKYTEDLVDKLADALVKFPSDAAETVESIIKNFESGDWILCSTTLGMLNPSQPVAFIQNKISDACTELRKNELTAESICEVAKGMEINSRGEDHLARIKRTEECIDILKRKLNTSYPLSNGSYKRDDLETKVKNWVTGWKKEHGNVANRGLDARDDCIISTMAIIFRAIEWHYAKADKLENLPHEKWKHPRDAKLFSVFMLIQGLTEKATDGTRNGRLGQINTGEGKSSIVVMFAAFSALLKGSVHVITSNKVLALADSDEFQTFFEILGLKCGNNCDKKAVGDDERRNRYNNNHVVNGELAGFQADILHSEFYGRNIISPKSPDVLIVDEVNSLLLDKGSNMLYLSHTIPELKHLRGLFLLIWDAVQSQHIPPEKKKDPKPYTETDILVVRNAVKEKIDNVVENEVFIPDCLMDFVSTRLNVWVKQAFVARFMPANEQFKIDEAKQRIINMDQDTGVEQGNMHLSLGLHQFLQLKHKSKLSPESLKCVFMSNDHYFQRFTDGRLFGITGTLGGQEETDYLVTKYKVGLFCSPSFRQSRRVEIPAVLKTQQTEWIQEIVQSVKDISPKQPILIITENLAQLELISEQVRNHCETVYEYKSSEKQVNFTKEVEQREGLQAGEVVVSTNLGGRGTDLSIYEPKQEKGKPPLEKLKGLHVILSYFPSNLRVEQQSFGRTARAGKEGTAQFIIKSTSDEATIYSMKEKRKQSESARMHMMQTRQMVRTKMEDQLFTLYKEFVNRMRRNETFRQNKKMVREAQLGFLNNRWAVWLDSIRNDLDNLPLQGLVGEQTILEKYRGFEKEQRGKLWEGFPRLFAEFPSELTKLGLVYEEIALRSVLTKLFASEDDEVPEESKGILATIGHGVGATITGIYKGVLKTVTEPIDAVKKTAEILMSAIPAAAGLAEKIGSRISECFSTQEVITVGVKVMEEALKDVNFSEAASLNLAGLLLTNSPGNRVNAKSHLKLCRNKLANRLAQNHSATRWLENAHSKMNQNGETIINLRSNMFEEQVRSESNLLYIHLDAVNSILQTPLNPGFIRRQIQGLDSEEIATQLLKNVLLNEKLNIVKGYRVSRKFHPESYQKDVLNRLTLPALPSKLSDLLDKWSRQKKTDIQEKDFQEIVVTKKDFLSHLSELGLTSKTEREVITLNIESYKKTKSHCNIDDFTNLKYIQEPLALHLSRYKGSILSPSLVKAFIADGNENEYEHLRKTLKAIKWIDKAPMHLVVDVDNMNKFIFCLKLSESMKMEGNEIFFAGATLPDTETCTNPTSFHYIKDLLL